MCIYSTDQPCFSYQVIVSLVQDALFLKYLKCFPPIDKCLILHTFFSLYYVLSTVPVILIVLKILIIREMNASFPKLIQSISHSATYTPIITLALGVLQLNLIAFNPENKWKIVKYFKNLCYRFFVTFLKKQSHQYNLDKRNGSLISLFAFYGTVV